MARITSLVLLLMSGATAVRAQLPAPSGTELYRVRTASTWTTGTLEPIGADSFRLSPGGAAAPLILRRQEIIALQHSGRPRIRPLAGLALGAGAGLVASVDVAGPLLYRLATETASVFFALTETPAQSWPDYSVGPLVNRTGAVLVGAGLGLVLAAIPHRTWGPVAGFAFDDPATSRRSKRSLAAKIGLVTLGSVVGSVVVHAVR